MNPFILYVSFSYCSAVNLRLLALDMLFLSAASRLRKQSMDKFPSSLPCTGYGGGLQLQGSDYLLGSGLQRIPRRTITFSLFPLVRHGATMQCRPTALLTLYTFTCPQLGRSIFRILSFIPVLSSHCHHKVT